MAMESKGLQVLKEVDLDEEALFDKMRKDHQYILLHIYSRLDDFSDRKCYFFRMHLSIHLYIWNLSKPYYIRSQNQKHILVDMREQNQYIQEDKSIYFDHH